MSNEKLSRIIDMAFSEVEDAFLKGIEMGEIEEPLSNSDIEATLSWLNTVANSGENLWFGWTSALLLQRYIKQLQDQCVELQQSRSAYAEEMARKAWGAARESGCYDDVNIEHDWDNFDDWWKEQQDANVQTRNQSTHNQTKEDLLKK